MIGIANAQSSFINGVNGNIVGSISAPVDPQIGTLAENGGGLPTHALLPTSRAIDAGNNAYATDRQGRPQVTDQRGYNRIVNSTVDMGAYEFGSQLAAQTSTITGQVTNANGRSVSGARIILRNNNGEVRYAMTNPFGYYRFVNVPAELTYTIGSQSKKGVSITQTSLIEETFEYINFQLN